MKNELDYEDLSDQDTLLLEWLDSWPTRLLHLVYGYYQQRADDPRHVGYPAQQARYRALAQHALQLYLMVWALEDGA